MDIKEIERRIYNEFIGTNELHRLRIKNLFLDTILPEVLRDLVEIPKIDVGEENTIENSYERGIVFGINARTGRFIVDTKEKYNITL